MGLNFRRTPRRVRDEPSASITWCEYVSALAAATDPATSGAPGIRADGPALSHAVNSPDRREPAVLQAQVRRRPDDEVAHRLLGLDHLARGQIGSAVRHLEIALRLIRRDAQRAVGLADALHLSSEAATLRLLLIHLHMRLGNTDRAEALAQESRALL